MHQKLAEIPLFDGIKPTVLKSISPFFSSKKYKRKKVIIRADQENDRFYIIKSGELKVYRINKYNQEILLALLGEGDFFGEMSILDGNMASANVAVLQPCELLSVHKRDFMKIMKTVPKFSAHMFHYLTQRIRSADENIENLNRPNSYERIAAVLVQIAERSGYRKRSSVVIDKIPFQHNIASLAGTSRETVSRALNQLKEDAYIYKNGRHLVIRDYPRFYEEFTQ